MSLSCLSVETDVPSEGGSAVKTIPIGARQASQSAAVPPQRECVWDVADKVYTRIHQPPHTVTSTVTHSPTP